jgi:hypothetical protein
MSFAEAFVGITVLKMSRSTGEGRGDSTGMWCVKFMHRYRKETRQPVGRSKDI